MVREELWPLKYGGGREGGNLSREEGWRELPAKPDAPYALVATLQPHKYSWAHKYTLVIHKYTHVIHKYTLVIHKYTHTLTRIHTYYSSSPTHKYTHTHKHTHIGTPSEPIAEMPSDHCNAINVISPQTGNCNGAPLESTIEIPKERDCHRCVNA